MGADGARAVRPGAAQPELEAGAHVRSAPMGDAVGADRLERAHEGAVGVGRARPDKALVEVGVEVDRAGPDHPAREVEAARGGAGGLDRGDAALLDDEVEEHEAGGVRDRPGRRRVDEAGRHAGAGEGEAGLAQGIQRIGHRAASAVADLPAKQRAYPAARRER